MKTVRTRIAPSPTGDDFHIGNAYTALINYVFAKKNGGQFLIRIEDTDRTRLVEGSEQRILASLEWLGIPHDEGPDIGGPHSPYRQSERLGMYRQYAEQLVESGHAYFCFCTSDRLESMRKDQEKNHQPPMYDGTCKRIPLAQAKQRVAAGEKHVIRMNVPDEGMTTFTDLVRGEISFENKLIDDQVLLKSDNFPTYHLGVVVDDHSMGISHIIRGEEWISSTPKHVLLYNFFGWEMPQVAHMPVLRNPDKSKLSKRKNPVWVSWFRTQGFLPEAIRNYLGTLAWTFPGKEIFTLDEMIAQFDLGQIQTTAPIFNTDKLRWLNGEYLRTKSDEELTRLIAEFLGDRLTDSYRAMLPRILPLIRERMKTLAEFESLAWFFFVAPKIPERPVDPKILAVIREGLRSCVWEHDAMEEAVRTAAAGASLKPKDAFMELRVAVTGKTVGPPLLESLIVLGQAETLNRISSVIS